MAVHIPLLHRMDAVTYTIYRYTIPYHKPFWTRSGLLLRLLSEGKERSGEIAPLPGRSKETLVEALTQLSQVLKTKQMPSKLYPSVSFGLYCAFSAPSLTHPLPLSALLVGTAKQILKRAETAYAQGYRSAKVKVSGMDLSSTASLLKELSSHFSLRVDANRAFSYSEALLLCERGNAHLWEYIEEPTYEEEKLAAFPYPFALDESLCLERAAALPCAALILKPTLIGGYDECFSYAKLGKKCILSSACETAIGLLGIGALATALSIETPLGLDTYRFGQKDVLQTPLDFSRAECVALKNLSVDWTLLEEVAHE